MEISLADSSGTINRASPDHMHKEIIEREDFSHFFPNFGADDHGHAA